MFIILLVATLLISTDVLGSDWSDVRSPVGDIALPTSLKLADGRYILNKDDVVVGEEWDENGLFLTVRRFEVNAGKSPSEHLSWAKADPDVTYALHREGMSVVSGVREGTVFYIKCRSGPLRCMEFSYPVTSKVYFDPVVARIANSFRQ